MFVFKNCQKCYFLPLSISMITFLFKIQTREVKILNLKIESENELFNLFATFKKHFYFLREVKLKIETEN